MGRSGWPDGRLPPPVGGTTVAGTSAGALTVAAGSGKGCGRGRRNGRDTWARTGRGEVPEGKAEWKDGGGRWAWMSILFLLLAWSASETEQGKSVGWEGRRRGAQDLAGCGTLIMTGSRGFGP